MELKADFHLHTNKSEGDQNYIKYGPYELIDHLATLGFSCASITDHNVYTYDNKLAKYAKKKGILLIPGMEKTIEGKHTLLINVTKKQADLVTKLSDLPKIRNKNTLIIVPHPFFHLRTCWGKLAKKNPQYFDAIEHSFFHTKILNRNKPAQNLAISLKKPMIATSDAHHLSRIGKNFNLIPVKSKNASSVILAIKKSKHKMFSKILGTSEFIVLASSIFIEEAKIQIGLSKRA